VGQLLTEAELVEVVSRDRAAGRRLALANGCFDILHVGHVRYLRAAATQADRLIVAVNDDQSVRVLKGEGRPFVPAQERAEILAALEGVDYVVVFGDPTVERLLLLLKPDVHCKGRDYTVESVPEREVVRAYGGLTMIVGDEKDHSSREVIRRITAAESAGGHASPLTRIDSVLLVRLGSLGDVVHAIPVAAALRRALPTARLDWVVNQKHRALLDLVPVLDRVIGVSGMLDAMRAIRRSRYDVAIDLQGLVKSAVLARGSGATRVVGFAPTYLRERLARPFYSDLYDPGCGNDLYDPRETRHVVEINLALLEAIGLTGGAPEFPIKEVASDLAREMAQRAGGRYVLLNPGAGWPNKRWPAARLGQLAAALRERHGLTSIALWAGDERALAEEAAAKSCGAALVPPPTSIADLVALTRGAAVMVSGDTGPIHIAAAVGTPVVAIFGPTRPARNGPWLADDVTVSRAEVCQCHHLRRCVRAIGCLSDISVEEVLAAVERRLVTASNHV